MDAHHLSTLRGLFLIRRNSLLLKKSSNDGLNDLSRKA